MIFTIYVRRFQQGQQRNEKEPFQNNCSSFRRNAGQPNCSFCNAPDQRQTITFSHKNQCNPWPPKLMTWEVWEQSEASASARLLPDFRHQKTSERQWSKPELMTLKIIQQILEQINYEDFTVSRAYMNRKKKIKYMLPSWGAHGTNTW